MIVWIVVRIDNLRATIVALYDTNEAALRDLELVAARLEVDLLDKGNGVYFTGLQEWNVDRHRVNLTKRIGGERLWRQMVML